MGKAIKKVPRRRKYRALPAYQYTPLELESDQIRLLTLLPGERSKPVKIRLDVVELSLPYSEMATDHQWETESDSTSVGDVGSATTLSQPAHALSSNATVGSTPSYEALSYAWGPTKDPTIVTIVENSAKFSLQITQNLAIALPYLRHRFRPRVFWIDAICVNQQDSEERSRQVERMCDIYTHADRVVVWLGPETHDSGLALSTLHALSQDIRYDWNRQEMEPVPGTNSQWADLAVRLRKGYCTDLPYQDIDAFNDHVRKVYDLAYSSMQRSRSALDWLIFQIRNSSCTDPKDRIYALRSLMHPSQAELIKPDYNKSPSEVYLETFIAITKHSADLDLLRRCNLRNKLPDCPTWVPNFNELAKTSELPNAFASGCWSACETQFVGEGNLCVAGRMVDVVKACLGLVPAVGSGSEVIRMIRHYVDTYDIGMDSQYVGGGSMLEACCRSITCNQLSDTYDDAQSFFSFREVIDAMRSVNIAQDFELALRSFNNHFIPRAVLGRKLVVTDAGYLGLVPEETIPGDVVCVLLGCDNPMLLRGTHDGSHEVVGQTYVQGLMDSEALLGPIGEQWMIKKRLHNRGYRCQGFLDLRTGTTTGHDPRLGPLPDGWEIRYDQDDEVLVRFEDTHTGNITRNDPRLSSDALRKRGVNMQTFNLV